MEYREEAFHSHKHVILQMYKMIVLPLSRTPYLCNSLLQREGHSEHVSGGAGSSIMGADVVACCTVRDTRCDAFVAITGF